jgi:hypothetical protein
MAFAAITQLNGPVPDDEWKKSALMRILMADDIVPGAQPSYETCKEILLFHPLGAKMAEAPIKMAQSQPRAVTVQGAEKEIVDEFQQVWTELRADANILNLRRLARVYGVSALVIGCEGVPSEKPLDMTKLWDLPIYFNVFDPLNISGSVIMNQAPNTPDFNRVTRVVAAGETYHRSRYRIAMNEEPIYIAYVDSGFGFTGRSVYQRALFPLKSFIKTMIADDMIATKNGLLVQKLQSPGSVVNKIMQAAAAMKRFLLKAAHVGQVMTIGVDEDVATLNMQNVDGAGTFARTNILKNASTAADMPAKLLENETMIGGMAEGTEDAKQIAKYIDGVRVDLKPDYDWFDNIVRYRAWMAPAFYKRIQGLYPAKYKSMPHEAAFMEWCRSFASTWPSFLIEPESENVKFDSVRLEATVALLQTLLPEIDPQNKARLIQWAIDNAGENKRLFAYALDLDIEELIGFYEKQQKQQDKSQEASQNSEGGTEDVGPEAKKFGRFDSATDFTKLRTAVDALRPRVASVRA